MSPMIASCLFVAIRFDAPANSLPEHILHDIGAEPSLVAERTKLEAGWLARRTIALKSRLAAAFARKIPDHLACEF
jgi:hypothetical protein